MSFGNADLYLSYVSEKRRTTNLDFDDSILIDGEGTIKGVIRRWKFEGCRDLHFRCVTDTELKSVVGTDDVVGYVDCMWKPCFQLVLFHAQHATHCVHLG